MAKIIERTAKDIGLVETQYFAFGNHPGELALESGEKLGPVTLAYETYGTLNKDKSNAILILHALTGNAHVAGFHPDEKDPGWWDNMIGHGKAFDIDKYYVICSNIIGGCQGSTGPSSINPKTGKPYGLDFPLITIKDMVNAQAHLVHHPVLRSCCVSPAVPWAACRCCNGRFLSRRWWPPQFRLPLPPGIPRSRSRLTKWEGKPSWPTLTGRTGTIMENRRRRGGWRWRA